MRYAMIALILSAVGAAQAPPPPPAPLPSNAPGISHPIVIEKHEPQYSEEARQARLNGSVDLKLVVDETGAPRDLTVVRSLGLGLDEEAIKAVRTWRFRPATKEGTPVPVFATIQVNFRLLQAPGNSWHLERANLDTPPGVARPLVIGTQFPKSGPDTDTTIAVSFDINETGVPISVSVANAGSSPLEDGVVQAMKQWRFTPARKDAYAIPVHATFVFVARTGSTASSPSSEPRLAGGVMQPRLLSHVEPSYSDEARKAKLEGIVMIRAVVGTTGVVSDINITQSLGLGLDETAMRAVRQWRYSPGTKDGAPVPVTVTLRVNFGLASTPAGWRLASAAFETPEGAMRPLLTKAEYPHDPPKERARLSLSFEIDEHGQPKNLNVDTSVDSRVEQDIIASVKKWRFKPAMKNGLPVHSQATFDFIADPWAKSGGKPHA